MVKKETVGRQGKIAGQPAHTREVKLGCVFTQTTWDKKGYPIRAPDSTTYTGAVETAEEFGRRLYREAGKRGWSRAQKRVVMGDGAEWIWNLAALHFPDAMQIVDLYHARQHLWELARRLYPNDEGKQKAWMKAPPEAPVGQGENRKARGRAPRPQIQQPRSRREDPHRSRLLREERRAHALPQVPPPTPLRGLGRHRSRMQNRGRFPSQALRECSGPSAEPTPSWLCAVLISMAALRITGRAAGRLLPPNSNFYVAHPPQSRCCG